MGGLRRKRHGKGWGMMKIPRGWFALLVLFGLASASMAETSLSIRLVEASNTPGESSPALKDVLPVLKNSLPYSTYRLLGSGSAQLPAAGQTVKIGEYSVRCQGAQEQLSITVTRGGQVMLTTQVRLRDRIPLILGGFTAGAGKHVLVFTTR